MGRGKRQLRLGNSDWGRLRGEANLSLRELEKATGIHRYTLSLIDQGRLAPKIDEYEKLAVALRPTASTEGDSPSR